MQPHTTLHLPEQQVCSDPTECHISLAVFFAVRQVSMSSDFWDSFVYSCDLCVITLSVKLDPVSSLQLINKTSTSLLLMWNKPDYFVRFRVRLNYTSVCTNASLVSHLLTLDNYCNNLCLQRVKKKINSEYHKHTKNALKSCTVQYTKFTIMLDIKIYWCIIIIASLSLILTRFWPLTLTF